MQMASNNLQIWSVQDRNGTDCQARRWRCPFCRFALIGGANKTQCRKMQYDSKHMMAVAFRWVALL